MSSSSRIAASRSAPKKSPVVVDLGSAFIKCGFAGEPQPIQVMPSVVCGATQGQPGKTFEEWVDVLTKFFSKLYTEILQCRPRDRAVILCESMVCPRELREAVGHVLFGYLQVPAIHACPGPSPALYCTGLDTGIVLDVGAVEAHVVAVYRGMAIVSSYAAVPLGCYAVQERVREMIAEEEAEEARPGESSEGGARGSSGAGVGGGEGGGAPRGGGGGGSGERRPLTRRELEEVTVQACLVPVSGVPRVDQVSPMQWVFTGKRRVTASAEVRGCAAEQALFEGDEEGRTLATLVLDSLRRCPQDCRAALVQNLVVSGGGALFPGLCPRLAQEIRSLAGANEVQGQGDAAACLGNPQGYSWARAVISGGDADREVASGARGLCVVRTSVPRNLLLWTGASIMAGLTGIGERSLTGEQYVARGGRMPDWMSVSPSDWLFSAAPSATRALTGVSQ